jgi:hypothetical protein
MKSPQVYSVLRENVAPMLKLAGFKRANSMLSWTRPQGNRHVVVWCQVSQDGWDEYAGSKFITEFQLSDKPIVGAPHSFRRRFGKMLDASGHEELRIIQNWVIASLRRPPEDHHSLHVSEQASSRYLQQFQIVDRPYGDRDDIWLRYAQEQHVVVWAKFLIEKLPECFRRIEAWE